MRDVSTLGRLHERREQTGRAASSAVTARSALGSVYPAWVIRVSRHRDADEKGGSSADVRLAIDVVGKCGGSRVREVLVGKG